MNVVVCVKEVVRFTTFTAFGPDSGKPVLSGRVHMPDPCDESAMEAALRLVAEAGQGQITVVCLGPERAAKTLRWFLAMGAHQAVHIVSEKSVEMAPLIKARLLALVLKDLEFDMVLTGRASLDHGSGQVGTLIAQYLGLSVVTGVVRIQLKSHESQLSVERALERGDRQTLHCPLPAVMTVDRALNRPRYPNLAGRLSAKSAKIREIHPRTDTTMQAEMERVPAMVCVGHAPPKILPKKIVAPDSGLSAANRIKFIMSGGMGQKTGARVDGDPEKMARAVFEFLKEKNIIRSLREP